ncbi:hypothetical protein L1987_05059 [Smallanthus sonchifolius]|uniref:Uncharacterized protein n=1 Tax=Smallanthus sonchifolius TaxID=185202 RepID=A0ACB9JUA3_9ASTR|nr:hypothetical protein L1987_05059 [Smallanthus sonchifolius]
MCTGGSTSTISSRKRRGGAIVSCKNCGGRPAILSTVFTSLINSDFTWTNVSKGCRSSSRRPRRSNSNTVNLSFEELLTKDTTDLEMPVSESEKLGVFVLGCHFSEKAIKKRRFLFRASSPPRNTANPPLEGAERHETSPKLNSNASLKPAICERSSKDHKLDKKEVVKDDDFCVISMLAAAACSNSLGADRCEGSRIVSSVTKTPEVPKAVEFNENNVKKEPDSHTSTTPFKGDESTLNNSSSHVPLELAFSKTNQEPSIQKSPARDAKFSWDLNTVMDAWEEPFVSEHDKATYVKEKKNDYTKANSESPSKSINNQTLRVEFNSLAHENKELKVEKCKPLAHEFDSAKHVVVVKTESFHDKHTDRANDVIPVTRTLSLENPTHGIFSKCVNLRGQGSGGLGSTQAVDTKLSIDCPIPPGFDHCLNLHASKENVGPTTQTVMTKHDISLKAATCVENGPYQSGAISCKVEDEAVMKMELTSNMVSMEDLVNKEETDKVGSKVVMEDQPAAISSMHVAVHSVADTGFGYNSQSDNKAGTGIAKPDENTVGYDSQYEDGELREWTINAWKGYELLEGENEYDMNRENGDIVDAHETKSQNGQDGSSGTIKLTELEPGKLHNSDDIVSGSEPNELTRGQTKSETQDNVEPHASQSDEWKMNVSGWDLLPESRRINSNSFNKTRYFTGRNFSYREEQKDRFETEDVEMKAEGSRFYRKESLTRIGGPSARDVFLSRGRFQMQGCSSKEGDGLTSRPERESGALRSFGRGRYSPHNRSLERDRDLRRLPSPSYQRDASFHRFILEDSRTMDNMKNEGGMDPCDVGRRNISSYANRRPFRSRSPMDREINEFRARLGLRPTGDTGHDRFVDLSRGRGRGRSMRYGTRLDGEGPRGRYHGPVSDECDEFMPEYSHPFPRQRRCFSPIERRGNNSYQHHQSDSRSPSRPRTRSPNGNSGFRRRSRSPGFRPDARIRRPRSPGYRDHPSEYNLGPRNNNSSPLSSRWVNYKERAVFNRSPPPRRPDGPHGERFSFYDSSRKPYRTRHPGNDLNEGAIGRAMYVSNDGDRPDNGYRRGGLVRRYNMDGPAKRFQYDDEDGCSRGFDARDRHSLEVHARSDLKPATDGTDCRFRDFPRRQREDSGEFKRRSREGKDREEVKDQSTTTTNHDLMMANEGVKEGD